MTIERRRPLPPGRYWADVFEQNRIAWEAWAKVNASHVRVVATEHSDSDGVAPSHDFVVFVTDVELVWPDQIMGLAPNVAAANVTSASDVVSKPTAESTLPSFSGALGTLTTAVGVAVGGALLIGLLALLARKR